VSVLQPFAVADATLAAYRSYIRSSFPLRDPDLESQREQLIEGSRLLWHDAFVSLARPGATGPKLSTLAGLLLDRTFELPWGFERLYAHQEQAIRRLAPASAGGPSSTLVLSGTGSGKTESFLIPIVDACLRAPGPGVKALVVYPMNALANDQLKRLRSLLAACPEVTFGRYTGDTPVDDKGDSRRQARPPDAPPNLLWSRTAMRETPPNILLTNYTMLEYLLLRGKDAELFRHGAPRYLVVDEIHLFTGVLGSEVANLLRRFRQHVGATPEELCAVGTSATAGSDEEQDQLLEFARRFFGVPFGAEAGVAEAEAALRPSGTTIPASPALARADLEAARSTEGLARLANLTLGVDLPADDTFARALGDCIDDFAPVSVLERALSRPASVADAALALGELPERAGVDSADLVREATALLLLGAAATQPAQGEDEDLPRFHPRVHQIVRSLSGLWRCTDPNCGRLVTPEGKRCTCGAAAIPLATCRSCGEAYWSSPRSGELDAIDQLLPVERHRRTDPGVFLLAPGQVERLIEDDEDGNAVRWDRARVCPRCLAFAIGDAPLAHLAACETPQEVEFFASTDYVHCPSCGDQGAQNRPLLLPLYGSAAASVAVLTQSLSNVLRADHGVAGARLLVFADSRQDAGQQAGYADDQGSRVAVRQLLVAALDEGPLSLSEATKRVPGRITSDKTALRRWLVGEADRRLDEVAGEAYEPSSEDAKRLSHQLQWEVALELTERARRRFSLEQEGVVVVGIDRLDELVAAVETRWPTHPFGGRERLAEVLQAVVDAMRYARAVDFWMLKQTPRALIRNHGIRIGDRAVATTRGWARKKYFSRKDQVDLRSWTADRYATRVSELIGRVLDRKPAEVAEVVETMAEKLRDVGLLAASSAEGRSREMVDHQRIVVERRVEQPLWRCNRCGKVRGAALTSVNGDRLCANWRCAGIPQPFEPATERDFYRDQYLDEPRRLVVREHSGQVAAEERLALEASFNNPEHVMVDVLACTPTLEVGVSLDDLNAVILRNLPPSPANYAQRVGRAGRRSKVALAIAHAGQSPHDSYFFEYPVELIAGLVKAPTISLDNEPLLRRHVNSLLFETLGVDLPERWVPPIGYESTDPSIADESGVLRESTIAPFAAGLADPDTRERIEAAVRGAFASPSDPAPPAHADEIALDQVDRFVEGLRAALNRWCDRYRLLVEEYQRLRGKLGLPSETEQKYEKRLLAEIQRLAEPSSPEYQPLGFLGLVGFLPRYGFTGETVLLHPPFGEEPIGQAAHVAVTEFAPANVVYARGRRLKVRRLDPAPIPEAEAGAEHRDNVLREGRRCDECEYLSFEPLEKSCPTCARDLVAQRVVGLTGVAGSGGAISSDDEYRTRAQYDLGYYLGGTPSSSIKLELGGLDMEWTSGRTITLANRGPRTDDEDGSLGFDICTGCGWARETAEDDESDEDDDERGGHAPRCPGIKDATGEVLRSGVWLSAAIRGEALEIELPAATRGGAFLEWRTTLAEALKLGIRDTMQAGNRDIDSFVRQRNGEPWSIVLFDTMPGGTGYLSKLVRHGGEGLKAVAASACSRLESCSCDGSCHRCLREFLNQRVHDKLNRFEVLATLRRLAEGEASEALDPENEKLESFLEVEFAKRLQEAGLPTPTLQVVRRLGDGKVIRADAVYSDPNIRIFLDGREYHANSIEKIERDLEARNRLEAAGDLVLELTFGDVMDRFDEVADALRAALERRQLEMPGGVAELQGIEASEPTNGKVDVVVDGSAWLASERAREEALRSCNLLRLSGLRLSRSLAAR
jgi:ATP-dependent helicase YprA (DUF1998 family)